MKFEFCRRKAVYQFSKLMVFEIIKFKSNGVYGEHIEKDKKKLVEHILHSFLNAKS